MAPASVVCRDGEMSEAVSYQWKKVLTQQQFRGGGRDQGRDDGVNRPSQTGNLVVITLRGADGGVVRL